ncbi:hypothetical protein [Streptomyces sp. NPDC098090]|uniref:hypothetical protein n=1 Tax=Streptomyces sp. NPDC098090 TaxID=3366095 RepID=UPI00380BA33D
MSIRNVVARLRACPSADAVTVEATVRTAYDSFRTAYDSFHQARARAYVPILVECRSRRALRAACRAAQGHTVDGVRTGL